MVVSGVPQPNGIYHAHQVACMALDVVKACKAFVIPHRPKEPLVIRIGMHSGQSHTIRFSCCRLDKESLILNPSLVAFYGLFSLHFTTICATESGA